MDAAVDDRIGSTPTRPKKDRQLEKPIAGQVHRAKSEGSRLLDIDTRCPVKGLGMQRVTARRSSPYKDRVARPGLKRTPTRNGNDLSKVGTASGQPSEIANTPRNAMRRYVELNDL